MSTGEETYTILQKGLSEWWSEETEYVFQRIERWAAFARGYNRLRSQRLSKGRMTMSEEPDSTRWTSSSNKLIIEDSWNPRFHSLKRSHRRKARPEETKINCCGTFNYQSNGNLDSNCLERYRYDHSIYFKTIGDIRSSKKGRTDGDEAEEKISVNSEQLVDWESEPMSNFVSSRFYESKSEKSNRRDSMESAESTDSDREHIRITQNVWPIVDLTKLNLNFADADGTKERSMNNNALATRQEQVRDKNNNSVGKKECSRVENGRASREDKDAANRDEQKPQEGAKRFLSFRRRSGRMSRTVKQPPITGNNKVIWPRVLLNYTKNADYTSSPYRHCTSHINK